jgi:DDE superfamily endonuclease
MRCSRSRTRCCAPTGRSLVGLVLAPEHRRGHGAMYAALKHGRVEIDRLRQALAATPMPRAADGRLVLAVDVTCWLRPEAHTSPGQILCYTYGRGKDQAIMIPGWPYSVVDAGYDVPRLAHLLGDLPVQVLGRMRSDRVLRRAAPPRVPGTTGRPPRHGGEFVFGDPPTWGQPDHTMTTDTRLYGPATARAWDRLHPRLTRRAAWYCSTGLRIIEGHRNPPTGRPPAQRRHSETGVAVVVTHRRHTGRRGPALAGVPTPLRHRAHVPAAQTDLEQDLPEDPQPAHRRPLDLAHPRRLRPATPGPTVRMYENPYIGKDQ